MPPRFFLPLFCALGIARADIVIVQKVDGPGQSGEMTIKLRGEKMRIDVAQQMSVIRDAGTGESVTLMHPPKSYLRLTAAASEALRQRVAKQAAENTDPASATGVKLQPTGKTEKISGFDTEEFVTEVGSMRVRYWIAKKSPHWEIILPAMLKMQENSLDQMMKGRAPSPADLPGMPVRTEMILDAQKVTTTILSVKEQPVSATEFVIPAGYSEVPAPVFDDASESAPAP